MMKGFGVGRTIALLAVLGLFGCSPGARWSPADEADGIRKVFQLASVEMVFHEVVYHYNESRWFIITYGTKETLFSIDLRVQGGFDLSEGWQVLPELNQKRVKVIFPPPKVLLVDADDRSIREYYSAGDPIGYVKLQGLLKERSSQMEQEALKRGLLERAKGQARLFATSFFSSLGFLDVEVEFRDGKVST